MALSKIKTNSLNTDIDISGDSIICASLDVTGNVGVGTSSPMAPLQIGDGASEALSSTAPFVWVSARALSYGGSTVSPQELLRLSWEEGSQDLGLNEGVAINFAARLYGDTAGQFRTLAQIASEKEESSDNAISSLKFSTSSDGTTANLTKRLHISSGGNVYVGNDTTCNLTDFRTKSITSNGYLKLPNGLILQWGAFYSTTDAAQTFSWPTTFPTACFSLAMAGDNSGFNGVTYTTTGFTYNRDDSNTDYTITYIAIGN